MSLFQVHGSSEETAVKYGQNFLFIIIQTKYLINDLWKQVLGYSGEKMFLDTLKILC